MHRLALPGRFHLVKKGNRNSTDSVKTIARYNKYGKSFRMKLRN